MALFNVKDFGAVGNGLADDTVAIRVALKYALANQSGVRFPAGQYLVTDLTATPPTAPWSSFGFPRASTS